MSEKTKRKKAPIAPAIPKNTYPFQNLSLEDMPGEQWLDIPGYEDCYMVSNMGRIKTLPREIGNKIIRYTSKERIIKQYIKYSYNAYIKDFRFTLSASLHYNRKAKRYFISRLCYSTFNIPLDVNKDKLMILHRDNDGMNNRLENLFAATTHQRAQRIITQKRTDLRHLLKKSASERHVVSCYDLYGQFVASYPSITQAARTLKVIESGISSVVNGRRHTCGGFLWRSGNSRQAIIPPDLSKGAVKPVSQYDLSGQWIATHPSIAQAAHTLKIVSSGVSGAINGRNKTAGGYLWRTGTADRQLFRLISQNVPPNR